MGALLQGVWCQTWEQLHEDSEHREFICAGASAGLSVRFFSFSLFLCWDSHLFSPLNLCRSLCRPFSALFMRFCAFFIYFLHDSVASRARIAQHAYATASHIVYLWVLVFTSDHHMSAYIQRNSDFLGLVFGDYTEKIYEIW